MSEILYFAYGSNMDQHRMLARGVKFSKAEKAILKGYKIVFNKEAQGKENVGYTNIIAEDNAKVEGVLYAIIDGMLNLDQCEGYPTHYNKKEIKVFKGKKFDKEVIAITYIAVKTKNGLRPEKRYLYHLIEGAKQHDLSKDYITELEIIKTID
jgi:gamma-glutamylcyclotransferase